MKTMKTIQATIQESYVVAVIAILGVIAFLSAILIAWPALAYLASMLFV